MTFINYYINFKNYELQDVEIQLQDLDTLEDPPGDTANVLLQGSDEPDLAPAIMESVNTDDDKTTSIKPKRLRVGFNSGVYDVAGTDQTVDVRNFSDGGDGRFLVRILTGAVALPFLGNLVLDDNSEAFQPRPNPVQLTAADGLNSLKDVELTESDGDIPSGHYRIIDYIQLCLRNLAPTQDIHVVFNLCESDTDPDVTHAFFDTFLDSRTFKKTDGTFDDCLTVLSKILDAFGCFISYDHDGWWIIRWDEYDNIVGGVTTLRTAHFNSEGTFSSYTNVDLNKVIAADYTAEYEGCRLSMDNAIRRFQRKAKEVKHVYKLEQIEAPCNANLAQLGAAIDDVLPLKTYEAFCWELKRGWGANLTTPNSEAAIWIRYDANDIEDERYLVLTPQASSGGEFNYVISEAIPIEEDDKFEFSFDYSADSDSSVDGPASIGISCVVLYGDDSSVWILGDNISALGDLQVPEWKLTNADLSVNFDYYQWFFSASSGTEDYTEFRNYSIEAPPTPVSGDLYIHFFAANNLGGTIDDFAIRYNNIQFDYIPFINGTYGTVTSQTSTVSADNGSRRTIEKEMFISDSSKRLFKGALKKFDGSNYVLTEQWFDYFLPLGSLSGKGDKLAKYIVFQWWNQFRKTRTVIESDFQGINSSQENGIPGLIHRWKIEHEDETEKYWMLTSLRFLNFRTGGWAGVLVETSDADGDRNYDDTFSFKYIQ